MEQHGLIGDPKPTAERPMITKEEVAKNIEDEENSATTEKVIIIILIILVVFGLLYLIFKKDEEENKKLNTKNIKEKENRKSKER